MDTQKSNGMKFEVGERRMYRGEAYEILETWRGDVGVYILIPFPRKEIRAGLTVNRLMFEELSTELTGMVGAIFGDT